MRKSLWALLMIVALLVAGCGPAMEPAAGPETESGEVFLIALPRIEIAFDQQGNPTVLGIKLADIGRFAGADLADIRLNEFYINWMTQTNIQHIEFRQTGGGMAWFVNGKALPYLGWTDTSLQQMSDMAAIFSVQRTDLIKKMLPIIRRLGLDIVLRFPMKTGAQSIALVDPKEAVKAATAPAATEPFVKVRFEIKYDAKGTPGILGITTNDLRAMGLGLPGLDLSPAAIQSLQGSNIQNLELRMKNDGLFVYVNGQPLPNIVWDDGFLTNASDIYAQMNPDSPYIEAVRQFVPMINKADVGIMVHFPLAAGATPVNAKMH